MDRYEEIKMTPCSHWSNAPYKEEVENGCISETAMARKIALRAFAAGAEWADAHPKNPWISVKDRLPEPEQEVLLYDNSSIKHYEIGWLRKKKRI